MSGDMIALCIPKGDQGKCESKFLGTSRPQGDGSNLSPNCVEHCAEIRVCQRQWKPKTMSGYEKKNRQDL